MAENETQNQVEDPKKDLNPFPKGAPPVGENPNPAVEEGVEQNERPEINAADYERYDDLSNTDLADVLGDHRLVRVYRTQNRHNGLNMPVDTDGLLGIARARLAGNNVPAPAPEQEPQPAMSKDAALAELKGIGSFDELLQAYKDLLVEKAPLVDDADGTQEFGEMRSRVLTDIDATNNEGKPTQQQIDDALVARYGTVNNLSGLETELSKDQAEEVQTSVSDMVQRIRESEAPAQEEPTPQARVAGSEQTTEEPGGTAPVLSNDGVKDEPTPEQPVGETTETANTEKSSPEDPNKTVPATPAP